MTATVRIDRSTKFFKKNQIYKIIEIVPLEIRSLHNHFYWLFLRKSSSNQVNYLFRRYSLLNKDKVNYSDVTPVKFCEINFESLYTGNTFTALLRNRNFERERKALKF